MRLFKRLLLIFLIGVLCLVVLGVIAGGVAWWLVEPRVPSVASLKDVQMQVPLRILSSDGQLIAEYGEMRRNPVQIANVPDDLKYAVLAAEDADFYHHSGIDVVSTLRAAMEVALHHGEKVQGGSTITQQVARNFFLSPQKTYTRKVIEILTSFRIERELSKDQILQLYLNKMFLGHRTYGVAAAAQYYYGKTIDQLSIPECAAIASTFQSPSVVNPIDHKDRLIARRNWVLGQMRSHRFIDRAQYEQAIAAPDDAAPHELPVQVDAPYLAEMVRQQALQRLGSQALTDGYVIRTTIDGHLQALANHALRSRLEDYDHRHGYRGPEAHVALPEPATPAALEQALSNYDDVSGLWPAIVTSVDAEAAQAYVQGGQTITLQVADMKWALGYARKAGIGGKGAASILQPGDIIRVREVADVQTAKPAKGKTVVAAAGAKHWELEQIPAAQAAMVVLSPDDGAVKALVGGFNFGLSKFNRATQTARQPGSSFKPFIYSAAFSRGYTPASIINDAPIALPDPSKPGGLWTPQNDDGKFRGPMRLREALAQSVNLVAIRLLDAVGVRYVRDYVTRFGFPLDAIPANLSMALGTASVSPMAMARAYSVFANGGFLVTPYYVAEIDNRDGKAIYKADPVQACRNCEARLLDEGKTTAAPAQSDAAAADPGALGNTANALSEGAAAGPLLAPRVIDPRNDYLITSLMHSVVENPLGTGAAVKKLGRTDLAGKTGTSNDYRDGWFNGFNGDLVTTVWVGLDDFKSLGHKEFGAQTALPIWMAFMGPALEGKPEAELPMPPGIVTASIDRTTGLPAPPGDTNTMSEMFKVEDLDRLRELAKQQQNQAPAYDIF